MTTFLGRTALPTILALDAATCAAMGVLLIAKSGPAAALTAIPASVLFVAGLMLLPIAAFMAIVATGTCARPWAMQVIVGGNLLWVLASVGLPMHGSITPDFLGWVVLMVQAAIVAVFAGLEYSAHRHSVPAA